MGVTKKCQEKGEECTQPDGGLGETLMGKEMGKEEGAWMGTRLRRQPLQTFCTSVALVGA